MKTHLLTVAFLALAIGAAADCNRPSPTTPDPPAPAPAAGPQVVGHTLSGTITEPGGPPIAGVTISTRPNPSGGPARTGTATTDEAGHYEIHDVAGCLWVRTAREGYEGGEWVNCVSVTERDATFDTTMQRVLRIAVGESLDERVLDNDMDWLIDLFTGDECGPCKVVRVVAPDAPGTVLVRLTWTGAPDAMSLWLKSDRSLQRFVGQNEASGSISVSSADELKAYVAWHAAQRGGNQPFHLETRFLAPGEHASATSSYVLPRAGQASAPRARVRIIR